MTGKPRRAREPCKAAVVLRIVASAALAAAGPAVVAYPVLRIHAHVVKFGAPAFLAIASPWIWLSVLGCVLLLFAAGLVLPEPARAGLSGAVERLRARRPQFVKACFQLRVILSLAFVGILAFPLLIVAQEAAVSDWLSFDLTPLGLIAGLLFLLPAWYVARRVLRVRFLRVDVVVFLLMGFYLFGTVCAVPLCEFIGCAMPDFPGGGLYGVPCYDAYASIRTEDMSVRSVSPRSGRAATRVEPPYELAKDETLVGNEVWRLEDGAILISDLDGHPRERLVAKNFSIRHLVAALVRPSNRGDPWEHVYLSAE